MSKFLIFFRGIWGSFPWTQGLFYGVQSDQVFGLAVAGGFFVLFFLRQLHISEHHDWWYWLFVLLVFGLVCLLALLEVWILDASLFCCIYLLHFACELGLADSFCSIEAIYSLINIFLIYFLLYLGFKGIMLAGFILLLKCSLSR